MKIKELPNRDRPRERLWHQGAASLRAAELLAILLRTGLPGKSAVALADELLAKYSTLDQLNQAAAQDLAKHKGIGRVKAVQLKAAFELGVRLKRGVAEAKPVETAEDVADLLGQELRQLPRETLRLLALNTRSRLLAAVEISAGTLTETAVHPREIFKAAIAHNAAAFIIVHNHPSGDPSPSAADTAFTRQLREAAKLMEINFHDHVILGTASPSHPEYYSFREAGLL